MERRAWWPLTTLDARWVESILADARFAFRHFARTPLATITMIVLLAIGVGVNAGTYIVLRAVLFLPPRGISHDPALVRIRGLAKLDETRRVDRRQLTYPEVLEYAAHTEVFRDVAAWSSSDVVIEFGNSGQPSIGGTATFVTPNFFRVLGVGQTLGAGLPPFTLESKTPQFVAVIDHNLWEQAFGRAPDVIGKSLSVNGVTVTIVGVAAAGFRGTQDNSPHQRNLWLPLTARPNIEQDESPLESYDSPILTAAARLFPGVSAREAGTVAQVIGARSRSQESKPSRAQYFTDIVPLRGYNDRPGDSREMMLVASLFASITLLILLVTCTNVSALLAGLAVARRSEIGIRLSLGASRGRLVRQLVTETVLLAAAGAVLALLVMWALFIAFRAELADLETIPWNGYLFTLGFALATGIIFGISPALHATRLAVAQVLKESAAAVAGSRSWLQRSLVIAQITLTQPLLVGLGAFLVFTIGEFRGHAANSLNEHILSVRFNPFAGNRSSSAQREDMRRMQERFAGLSGVRSVVAEPMGIRSWRVVVHPEDRIVGAAGAETYSLATRFADRGYFALLEMPLVRGRDFDESERAAGREMNFTAVVLSSAAAHKLFGAANPIGRRLQSAEGPRSPATRTRDPGEFVVVGVVDDDRAMPGDAASTVSGFVAGSLIDTALLVRTNGPAAPLAPLIRSVARAELPDMPLQRVATLAEIERDSRASILQATGLAAAGGVLALLLSAIGLYAVV